ncbi:MAG: hypothetical protein EB034_24780 [Verrucomicrobia bacterium]|nr:hypothetical protein [Verrucomicrobiota bacterium]
MADYYTNFSLQLRLPNVAAQTYALALAEQVNRVNQSEEAQEELHPAIRDHADNWGFEVKAEVVEGQPGLWLHSSNGGIDAVCAFLQHLLQMFDPTGRVTFQWSHDCSKHRTDAYGGGAAIVTARKIKTMSTSEWLCKHAR